jgi:diguanylate cyclase (GGDEF)-like protein
MIPWWVLIPAYLAALTMTLEFEFRSEARSITLSQLPLAIGIVFIAPWWHVAARTVAAIVDSVIIRRQTPIKSLYNLANGALEVATASAVVYLLVPDLTPQPRLWGAIFLALAVADVITNLATTLVLRLVGAEQTPAEVLRAVVNCLGTSAVFAGFSIISVAAIFTDESTTAVIAVTIGGLILAYRGHRRLAAQQQQTSELHQFVKGLGPVDLDDEASIPVLEHVRLLLHAQHLELSLQHGNKREKYVVSGTADGAPRRIIEITESESPLTRPQPIVGPDDHMSTPLPGAHDLVGVLTVRERLGTIRGFELRDLRLLEAVAAELGGAIERGRLQRDLSLAATTDPLTHLPNLNEASRQLDALLATDTGDLLIAAVAVDSFREVNDTLGHQVGDELLLEVARRLSLAYPYALVGRIGGGRFLVAVPAESVGNDPSMFGLGLRAQVEGGAQLGPVGTHIRLSVGCVRGPEHGAEAHTLVRRAETAMYSARYAHGGPVVWEPAYEVEGQRRLAVVMALREALASGAIGVAYQPKIASQGNAVTGVEALARWTHPALGSISPVEFVPLAEAAGLMGPLTSTVLRQALTACKGWQRRAGRIGVAVNVSAHTVLDPTFVTEVAAILTSINISPDLLTLELTEGVVVDDPDLAIVRMGELRALGVKISVDDFGTGYSSLTYLKGLPVDEVKIDKGFVDGIAHDAGDRAVVRAVVDIAHTLGLRVVAEGVEQEDQHILLSQLGVDEIQGYLHARPMAGLDMAQWLRRREQAAQI